MYSVKCLDYYNRTGNLKSEASGVVSSTKYFPTYGDEIFKPLSKTKPLSTPLFAYAEVYWSNIINKFIDDKTPKYTLARCFNIDKEQAKYYDKGTLVDNILSEGEYLVNILELFRMYPDDTVDIDNYINYCEMIYDFEIILKSKFFMEHKDLARKLAEQVLTSILRRDENYHYENVSLIFKDGKVKGIAPMIDMEFSQFFMYPDELDTHEAKFSSYDDGMCPIFKYDDNLSYEENVVKFLDVVENGSIHDNFSRSRSYLLMRNIRCITLMFPDLVEEFISKLNKIKEYVKCHDISFNQEFLGMFSSSDWEATRMIYKENKSEDDKSVIYARKRALDKQIILDEKEFNDRLKREVLFSIDHLIEVLNMFIGLVNKQLPDLRNYKVNTLYKGIERHSDEIAKIFLSLMNDVKKKELK